MNQPSYMRTVIFRHAPSVGTWGNEWCVGVGGNCVTHIPLRVMREDFIHALFGKASTPTPYGSGMWWR